MSDSELEKCGKRVARTATLLLTQLAAEGITAAQIADLKTTAIGFEDAQDNQLDAINDRDIATEERIDAGNALYEKLVKFCNTGKDIWVNASEARYNDYIIYDSGILAPMAQTTPFQCLTQVENKLTCFF